MKIIPLGIAGFIPNSRFETCSYLVISGPAAILLDAGTGVRNLLHPQVSDALKGVDSLHVVFSHLHHDHTAGLTWLLRLWQRELSIHIPTRPLIDCDGVSAIKVITNQPFFGLPLELWPQLKEISPISEPRVFIGPFEASILRQKHSGGSIGIRIGSFAYITDTDPTTGHSDFMKGCDLAFLDTMHDSKDYAALKQGLDKIPDHGTPKRNSEIAALSEIKRLGLIHLDPSYDEVRRSSLLAEAQEVFKNSFLPEVCHAYEVTD